MAKSEISTGGTTVVSGT